LQVNSIRKMLQHSAGIDFRVTPAAGPSDP